MKNLSEIMEETVQIDVSMEDLFGMSENLNKLNILTNILRSKGDEFAVIAKELGEVYETINILMDRAEYKFEHRDEESA